MQVTSHGISEQGKVRSSNEDAFFIDNTQQIYAVADGIGGLPGGEEASQRIVELLSQTVCPHAEQVPIALTKLITSIHKTISEEGFKSHPGTGTGSTLTMGQIVGDQLFIGHVGDSAAYLLRGEEMTKLTVDHTMEQELIDRQGESARAIMPPEYPHTLTRCIGQGKNLKVNSSQISLQTGDRLLFCTDGLHKVISDIAIKEELARKQAPQETCHQLAEMANANKGPDNITIIVIHI
jgi:protein phosphatase